MNLINKIVDFINALGADIKALYTNKINKPATTISNITEDTVLLTSEIGSNISKGIKPDVITESIRVGGYNLVDNSNLPTFTQFSAATTTSVTNEEVTHSGILVRKVTITTPNVVQGTKALWNYGYIQNGDYPYSMSFKIKNTGNNTVNLVVQLNSTSIDVVSNEEKEVRVENIKGPGYLQLKVNTSNAQFLIWNLKVERATKSSDWTRSDVDQIKYLDNYYTKTDLSNISNNISRGDSTSILEKVHLETYELIGANGSNPVVEEINAHTTVIATSGGRIQPITLRLPAGKQRGQMVYIQIPRGRSDELQIQGTINILGYNQRTINVPRSTTQVFFWSGTAWVYLLQGAMNFTNGHLK